MLATAITNQSVAANTPTASNSAPPANSQQQRGKSHKSSVCFINIKLIWL